MIFNPVIEVGNKKIGNHHDVFIVAEIGPNHNGNLDKALELIRMASEAGADAVKFQSFLADHLLIETDPMYKWTKSVEMPEHWYPEIIQCAEDNHLVFFSTATNETTIDWLEKYGTHMYKIASAHVNHIPVIKYASQTYKPIILSTGFSYFGEIEKAARTVYEQNNQNLSILHCVSDYPTNPQDVNLNFIQTLKDYFDVPVGFSDHTEQYDIAVAAVAKGALIVEKHITFSKKAQGPDHFYALEPLEFKSMVDSIRRVEKALGASRKILTDQEMARRKSGRRTLHAIRDLSPGDIVSNENSRLLRPGDGIGIHDLNMAVGRQIKNFVKKFQPITWEDI